MQPLAYVEIEFDKSPNFETVIATQVDAELGYMLDVDSKKPQEAKRKTKYLHLCPGSKKVDISLFTDYMKSNFPHIYKPMKICLVVALKKKDDLCQYMNQKIWDSLCMEVSKIKTAIRNDRKP